MKAAACHNIQIDEQVASQLNVSRETIDKLAEYLAILGKWQAKINLISAKTLPDAWRRHILDSAQLAPFLPLTPSHILDIGSGAGFPGLVLSIVTPHRVTLVESDQRKAIFLRTVIRELNLTAEVINERIEAVAPVGASIVTARALAPVEKLLFWLDQQLPSVEKCLFLKGASVREELTALESYPNIDHRIFPSVSSTDGAVLELDTSKHHGMEF